MDLSVWSRKNYQATATQRFFLSVGAHPYRCEYCRYNFVSYRACKKKFSFKRRAGSHAPARSEHAVGGHSSEVACQAGEKKNGSK